ncbi:MAG: class I SAM-dependent methyltransferase [Agathobacter sp.]|nr:class I SAM-dependent methyltransferase [Agathobacter sp.]
MKDRCIVCGAKLIKPCLYMCKNMPNEAQTLPKKDELVSDMPTDYGVYQCSGCGLVQLNCEPVKYYKDSTRAGERCEALVKLRQEQYSYLIDKYNLNGKKIFEIGAGKGGFLKTLVEMTEYNVEASGIENNEEFVKIAREQEGVNVFEGYLSDENMKIEGGPFDAFVSFAYIARLTEPNNVLRCMYNNLKDDGVGLVQVPSLEHLLENGGFFDITKDHIAYYDENTLRFLLENAGFEVVEHGVVSKLYIYAIVKKKKVINLAEKWSYVEKLKQEITNYVRENRRNGKKIAVWCAGHFAFTILSVAELGDDISYIIDNASFKQDRYSPASHIPIFSPKHFKEEPVDIILILGPIYIDEIVNEIRTKCSADISIATMDNNGLREIK